MGSIMFMMGMEGMMMNKKHMMQMLMGLELMLLGLMMMSMMNGVKLDDMMSEMYTLKMLMMAAVESAMGLTMMMGYYSMSGKMEW